MVALFHTTLVIDYHSDSTGSISPSNTSRGNQANISSSLIPYATISVSLASSSIIGHRLLGLVGYSLLDDTLC